MKKFYYKVYVHLHTRGDLESELNRLADLGWEIVNVMNYNSNPDGSYRIVMRKS